MMKASQEKLEAKVEAYPESEANQGKVEDLAEHSKGVPCAPSYRPAGPGSL
jgi:hypothetical protein